jgi:hypothetical protein
MTNKEVALEIVYPLVLAIAVPALIAANRRFNAYSQRQRRARIAALDAPEFAEKSQRRVFILLGVAVYSLGWYCMLGTLGTGELTLWLRTTVGIVMALCGGMAAASAKTMNAYGIQKEKHDLAAIEAKELARSQAA